MFSLKKHLLNIFSIFSLSVFLRLFTIRLQVQRCTLESCHFFGFLEKKIFKEGTNLNFYLEKSNIRSVFLQKVSKKEGEVFEKEEKILTRELWALNLCLFVSFSSF